MFGLRSVRTRVPGLTSGKVIAKKPTEKGNLRIVAEIFTIFKFLNFTAL